MAKTMFLTLIILFFGCIKDNTPFEQECEVNDTDCGIYRPYVSKSNSYVNEFEPKVGQKSIVLQLNNQQNIFSIFTIDSILDTINHIVVYSVVEMEVSNTGDTITNLSQKKLSEKGYIFGDFKPHYDYSNEVTGGHDTLDYPNLGYFNINEFTLSDMTFNKVFGYCDKYGPNSELSCSYIDTNGYYIGTITFFKNNNTSYLIVKR